VFDYGEQRIGVAFANRASETATPLKTLSTRNGTPIAQEVRKLIREWQPDALVIGVPYNMDGSKSPMADRVIEFGKILGEQHGLPVDTVDERLTSAEAKLMLREQRRSGQRRRRVRREDVDSLAAQLIAESWLRNP